MQSNDPSGVKVVPETIEMSPGTQILPREPLLFTSSRESKTPSMLNLMLDSLVEHTDAALLPPIFSDVDSAHHSDSKFTNHAESEILDNCREHVSRQEQRRRRRAKRARTTNARTTAISVTTPKIHEFNPGSKLRTSTNPDLTSHARSTASRKKNVETNMKKRKRYLISSSNDYEKEQEEGKNPKKRKRDKIDEKDKDVLMEDIADNNSPLETDWQLPFLVRRHPVHRARFLYKNEPLMTERGPLWENRKVEFKCSVSGHFKRAEVAAKLGVRSTRCDLLKRTIVSLASDPEGGSLLLWIHDSGAVVGCPLSEQDYDNLKASIGRFCSSVSPQIPHANLAFQRVSVHAQNHTHIGWIVIVTISPTGIAHQIKGFSYERRLACTVLHGEAGCDFGEEDDDEADFDPSESSEDS